MITLAQHHQIMVPSTALPPPGSSVAVMRSPLFLGLQIVCFAVIFLYAIFFQVTRGLGTIGLIITLGCAVVLWLPVMRWYVQRLLLWYALVAGVYAYLSFIGVLHWNTLLFDKSIIVQQSIYAFILPVLVPVFAYYHERIFLGDAAFLALDRFLLLSCIASKLFYTASIGSLIGLGVIQFFNVESIFAFLLVRHIYYTNHPSLVIRGLIVIVLAATAGSFQSALVSMFLVGILIAPKFGRNALVCFILGLIAVSIIAIPYADAIWLEDANTGIRLFFWRDAVDRLIESWGVGQGFGTETIRPIYHLSQNDVSIATLDQPEFILIGSHNAFVDAGYRMGVLGAGILIAYVGGLFRSAARVAAAERAFDYFVCALLFVLLMVNVGLASINFLFGASCLMGWLAFRTAIGFAPPANVSQPAGDTRQMLASISAH